MAKYANQDRILMGERVVRDKAHPFTMMNLEALQQAMAKIKTVGGMKLWMYLNKNSDNYIVDLSRAELVAHWGFTKDTYLSGKNELKKLGYLTSVNGSDKVFTFHETLSENPAETDDLSENQTELIVDMISSENLTKEQEVSENPTDIDSLSENPTNISYNGFIF